MFSHRKKLLVIILISLLVISVIMVGVFAYEWLRTKGELAKQVEENASLDKQIEILQKEIEEATNWKTYRNEVYGFEVDYPNEWEFDDFANLNYWIFPPCIDYSCKEIVENSFECLEIHGLSFEKEIITNSGAKGCKARLYRETSSEGVFVVFPLKRMKKSEKMADLFYRNVLFLSYPAFPEPTSQYIETFNQVTSSFRYID